MKNPVAKNARKFNLAHVHKDKKKESKRGYEKHKSLAKNQAFFIFPVDIS